MLLLGAKEIYHTGEGMDLTLRRPASEELPPYVSLKAVIAIPIRSLLKSVQHADMDLWVHHWLNLWDDH